MPAPTPESVITPIQRDALRVFGSVPEAEEFLLSGATALAAFYLGHRRSRDLDLFTAAEPLITPASLAFQASLAGEGVASQIVRHFRTFSELVLTRGDETTLVQLAQDSPFLLEAPTIRFHNVRVTSFRDAAAGKLLAALGRAEPRDLIDVYVLIRDGRCTFEDLLRWAREKDPGLDAYYLAQSLRTVEELPGRVELLPVDMLVPLDVSDMKRRLLEEALRLLQTGLPP